MVNRQESITTKEISKYPISLFFNPDTRPFAGINQESALLVDSLSQHFAPLPATREQMKHVTGKVADAAVADAAGSGAADAAVAADSDASLQEVAPLLSWAEDAGRVSGERKFRKYGAPQEYGTVATRATWRGRDGGRHPFRAAGRGEILTMSTVFRAIGEQGATGKTQGATGKAQGAVMSKGSGSLGGAGGPCVRLLEEWERPTIRIMLWAAAIGGGTPVYGGAGPTEAEAEGLAYYPVKVWAATEDGAAERRVDVLWFRGDEVVVDKRALTWAVGLTEAWAANEWRERKARRPIQGLREVQGVAERRVEAQRDKSGSAAIRALLRAAQKRALAEDVGGAGERLQ